MRCRYCSQYQAGLAITDKSHTALTVHIGQKTPQSLEDAYPIEFSYRVATATAAYLAMIGSDKVKYFEGTPIPGLLLLVVVIAIAAVNGVIGDAFWFGTIQMGPGQFHPLVLMFAVSGLLMISRTLHIPER